MKCTFGKEKTESIFGSHDWVLVPQEYADSVSAEGGKRHWTHVLWACPCGEFRWTSYADWAKSPADGFAETANAGDSVITVMDMQRAAREAYEGRNT